MSIRGITSDLLERRPGQKLSFVLIFISIVLYVQIAYFTPRTETAILLSCYLLLFGIYLIITKSILSFQYLLAFGIAFRIIMVFSIPNLSDDFYRFFWDGMLIDNRINPFLQLPREIADNQSIIIPQLNAELLNLLNSPDYYTVYPPVCQFVFWLSAFFSEGDIRIAVLIMKSFVFLAEMGSIFLLLKLLKIHHLRREYIYFYLFNPLIIIELVGNIHFEAFMILFVLWAVLLVQKRKYLPGAVVFAFAISAKLTPILMLPFFLKRLGIKKAALFYLVTLGVVFLTFTPFLNSALFDGLSSSIGLYFQKFEFNASIFYIIREIGFWVKGWDIIQVASKWLALSTVSMIVLLSIFENNQKQILPGILIWPLFLYFAHASIIHPWYATPLVAFCWFSKYRFPVVWSMTIFLSYAGYKSGGFQEQLWVLLVEYLLVYGVLIYELVTYKDLLVFKNPKRDIFR